MKIKKMKILSHIYPDKFEAEINKMIDEGWQPFSPPSIKPYINQVSQKRCYIMVQPMVEYDIK